MCIQIIKKRFTLCSIVEIHLFEYRYFIVYSIGIFISISSVIFENPVAALLINRSSDENGGITRKVRKLHCPYIGIWIRDLVFDHLEKPFMKMMFYDFFINGGGADEFHPFIFLFFKCFPSQFLVF